jgi:hypothetical protein
MIFMGKNLECDLHYHFYAQPDDYHPFYNNIEEIDILEKEISLRKAWQNLGLPLGDIIKELITTDFTSKHIIRFKSQIHDGENFKECLKKYIDEIGIPDSIYANRITAVLIEDIIKKYNKEFIEPPKSRLFNLIKKEKFLCFTNRA